MRNILLLIFAFALVIFSCEQENSTQNSHQIELNKDINFENLTNSKIGVENEGKVKLKVSDEKIMLIFKKFVSMNSLDLKPRSFEVLTVNENNYLRFYSDDDQVSTIELVKGEDGFIKTGSTVCTSKACASCCGCLPDGDYCTKCKPLGPDSPYSGDCIRTSGGIIIDPNT